MKLYIKGYVDSKKGLQRALKTLEECGYVVSKRVEASTRSPIKKILYYPTPEGIYLHGVLALLYPQDLERLGEKWNKPIFSDIEASYSVALKLYSMNLLTPFEFGLSPPTIQAETEEGLKQTFSFFTLLYA